MIALSPTLPWDKRKPAPPDLGKNRPNSGSAKRFVNGSRDDRCKSALQEREGKRVSNIESCNGSGDTTEERFRHKSFDTNGLSSCSTGACDLCDMRANKLPDSVTSSINDTWPELRPRSESVKTFKVLLIGNSGVGKTSLVQRYAYGKPIPREYKTTLGVDFALKEVRWSQDVSIKLQLWDIAGQERFASMTRVYYKDAHACIIMFDVSRRPSFFEVLKWKNDLDSKCILPSGDPIPCILLANKCDLSHREVNQTEIEEFCKEHNFIGWTEVSVKENLMVDESMKFLMKEMMLSYSHDSYKETDNPMLQSISLHKTEPTKSKCSCS